MANQVLYGFHNLGDLKANITDVTIPVVNEAIDTALTYHTNSLNAILGLFAQRTTEYKEKYKSIITTRSQPLDENGKALPIKGGSSYDVAYPIQYSGNAWGANYITRAKMTVNDVMDITKALITGDSVWMRDHLLAALFYGTASGSGWSFDDPLRGSLTIQGLANGDSQTYVKKTGSAVADTHILGQADAIADAKNPYDDIYDELMEHPENGGEVVCFIPTNLRATTLALTGFKDLADPNIQTGGSTDVLRGTLNVPVPGTILGYVNKCWIVEWSALPDSYIVATTTEGDKTLALREEPEAGLQGFFRATDGQVAGDHPFYESQYLRLAGFGARNRVGSVVYRIGNATYAAPTGYGSPMA